MALGVPSAVTKYHAGCWFIMVAVMVVMPSLTYGQLTVLYHFHEDSDGGRPGGLAFSYDANSLFGTVGRGNSIWSFDMTTGSYTRLYRLSPDEGTGLRRNVLVGSNLLGLAGSRGANGDGSLWSFDTDSNSFSKLHDFNLGIDGSGPRSMIVDGTTIFGVNGGGGPRNGGTIWSFDLETHDFDMLYNFGLLDLEFDDLSPNRIAKSGTTLFGTTYSGGNRNYGTLWSFDMNTGKFNTLHKFDSLLGRSPQGIVANGETLYGSTQLGGPSDDGTIWTFNTRTGTFSSLYSFQGPIDGSGLGTRSHIIMSGTTLFGTATRGGANDAGTIWSFDVRTESFTRLYDLESTTEGMYPTGNLSLDGTTLYGSNFRGAHDDAGTIWALTVPEPSSHVLTTLACMAMVAFRRRA